MKKKNLKKNNSNYSAMDKKKITYEIIKIIRGSPNSAKLYNVTQREQKQQEQYSKKPNKQQQVRLTVLKSILTQKSKNHELKRSFQNHRIVTIGSHLATEQVFKSEKEAQKVIEATDWNLVAALIYACKEADRWEEEQEK